LLPVSHLIADVSALTCGGNIMRALSRIALLAVAQGLACCSSASAELMLFKIRTADQCPEGLTIKSKTVEGLIQFDVTVDAEKIANAGELYKDRAHPQAFLKIDLADQPVAWVTLHGGKEGRLTSYQFRVSPAAARSSELQLGVSLFEKDGFATLGGGVSMQIYLSGFEPKAEKAGEARP
jgi:hypothetical protein